jgi:hypothetical protein
MVMGAEKGIRLVDTMSDLEAFIVVEKSDGSLVDYSSRGFKPYAQPK